MMSFPFMQLPVELRLVIYEEFLSSRLKLITLSRFAPARPICFSLDPTILRTSKTIYAEALPVLYGSNTFAIRVYHWEDLHRSHTKCMGLDNPALIRRIQFETHVENIDKTAVRKAVEAMGMDWENLQVVALRFGMRRDPYCVPEICEGQDWLVEIQSIKELKMLGLRPWGPLKTLCWYVRKTSGGLE